MSKAQIVALSMPSDEQIHELIRRGDRAGLLSMRDRVESALRGKTFSEQVALRVSEVSEALHAALTGGTVALSDRTDRRYTGRPGQPPDPPRVHDGDLSLPGRLEAAKRALSGADEQDAIRERASEVKRAMSPSTDDGVRARTDEARKAITGNTSKQNVKERADEVRRALEGK